MLRRIFEQLYRSPLGWMMSVMAHVYAKLISPFMVYGYRDQSSGKFRKYTRMSSSVTIMNKQALSVADNVWVGHYSILDATEGIVLEEGCQIAMWAGIFTHGSEYSIRLLGKDYPNIPYQERRGYTRGAVRVGAYTYLGSRSMVLPGVTIGKGCLIGAGALVAKDIPDYSIVMGSPGKIIGSTINADARFFKEDDFADSYYDAEALAEIQQKIKESAES